MNTRNMTIPSNKVSDIERYISQSLQPYYPEGEVRTMISILFEGFLGWNTVQRLLNRNSTVNQSDLLRFYWAVEDLKKFRPIQHIVGYTEFCGIKIHVNSHTLIPRPETEEIVNHLISCTPSPERILDLCTGSGCIAIALAKNFPQAEVFAVDLSPQALQMARKNAEENSVKVEFLESDVLQPLGGLGSGKFNLIVSNPPYVMQKEKSGMQPNVLDYEPHQALFVEDSDPLVFYREIIHHAQKLLSPKGILAMEINEKLSRETLSLLPPTMKGEVREDFRGKPRSIIASWA